VDAEISCAAAVIALESNSAAPMASPIDASATSRSVTRELEYELAAPAASARAFSSLALASAVELR